jgi:hypothetical protein
LEALVYGLQKLVSPFLLPFAIFIAFCQKIPRILGHPNISKLVTGTRVLNIKKHLMKA